MLNTEATVLTHSTATTCKTYMSETVSQSYGVHPRFDFDLTPCFVEIHRVESGGGTSGERKLILSFFRMHVAPEQGQRTDKYKKQTCPS